MKISLKIILLAVMFIAYSGFHLCVGQTMSKSEEVLIRKLEKYPSYREVVTHFFNNYYEANGFLQFAKKADGWHVYTVNYYEMDTIMDEMIWSSKNLKYRKLKSYVKNTPSKSRDTEDIIPEKFDQTAELKIENYMNSSQEREFNLQPYYGYIGWITDVMRLLSPLDLKSEDLIYALGRTYSMLSMSVIRPQYGNELITYPPAGYEKLESGRVKEYLLYADKALEQFHKVFQINPKYETWVGNIYTKYCNENLHVYHTLLSIMEEELAKSYLKEGLYNQQILAFAKNYLISCPPGAILITNGDNDTYPLWYLQAKYNYRTDVRVANSQLMMTDWYNEMLRENLPGSEGVQFGFSPEKIKGSLRDYVVYYRESEADDTTASGIAEFVNLKDALDIAFSDDEDNMVSTYSYQLHTIPSTNFFLPVDRNLILPGFYPEEKHRKYLVDTVFIESTNTYFLKNILVLYDMIVTNNWQRPLCFGITNDDATFPGLDHYLMQRGMVYQFLPLLMDSSDYQIHNHWINTSLMYQNLIYEFTYPDFEDKTFTPDNVMTLHSNNYRNMFSLLSEALLKEEDTLKAIEVLDFCNTKFPSAILEHGNESLEMCKIYFECKEDQKASVIAFQLLEKYNREADQCLQSKSRDELHISELTFILDYLSQIGEAYNKPEITSEAEKILNKLNNAD